MREGVRSGRGDVLQQFAPPLSSTTSEPAGGVEQVLHVVIHADAFGGLAEAFEDHRLVELGRQDEGEPRISAAQRSGQVGLGGRALRVVLCMYSVLGARSRMASMVAAGRSAVTISCPPRSRR